MDAAGKRRNESLIEASFAVENEKLEGIILHNLRRKYIPPEGFACIDLADIQLPGDAKAGLHFYLTLSDDKLSVDQRLEELKLIESQVVINEGAFDQLIDFGFTEEKIASLHRNFVVRKIESLHMPGEYFLTYIFTKNNLKVALAILATNEKIQSKFLEINAILSAFMNIRGAKLYAKYLQENYLDREIVLPGRNHVNLAVQVRNIVSLELQDGYSTLHFIGANGELLQQNIPIVTEEISKIFLVQNLK